MVSKGKAITKVVLFTNAMLLYLTTPEISLISGLVNLIPLVVVGRKIHRLSL